MSLTPSIKIGVLKGLSSKMRSPKSQMDSFKEPKLKSDFNAKLERKVNPDYEIHRKYNLNKKLY